MGAHRNGRYVDCANCATRFWAPRCRPGAKYCSVKCMRIITTGSANPVEAFWLKVDKAGPGGCWLYTGFRKWDGYGWLARYFNGKVRYLTAHRYSWILANGPVPDGLHVLHKCDVPACCNPAHLFLGTHQDNMKDRKAKGRTHGRLFPNRIRPSRKREEKFD